MSEPVKVKITNADLESAVQQRGPGGQAGPAQPLIAFALKDFAGVTIDLEARKALTGLARKISKAHEAEGEEKTALIETYGTKDENGNLVVKSEDLSDEIPEGKTISPRKEWKAAIKAWREKVVVECDPVTVWVYAEDAENLNPEFMAALSEIVVITLREGVKPDSLSKKVEKLEKEKAELAAKLAAITDTVNKKKD